LIVDTLPDSNECGAVLHDKILAQHHRRLPHLAIIILSSSPPPSSSSPHRLICSTSQAGDASLSICIRTRTSPHKSHRALAPSSHQPVDAEGSGPRGHPRATRHLAPEPAASYFAAASPSPCFSPSISPCTTPPIIAITPLCYRAAISPRDANHSFDRLPNARAPP
jgi:hypothetical protein